MMKILAIDHGTRRIGLAISDDLGILAKPLPFLPAEPEKQALAAIADLAIRESVIEILIGYPRHMNGSLGEAAAKVDLFIDRLQPLVTVPIRKIDERLSTVQASRQLRESGKKAKDQKPLIDSASAIVLLQGHLDASDF